MGVGREFQIFIKPCGASCNLECSYCYYLRKSEIYPGKNKLIMTDEVLEKYIVQHIEASDDQTIMFSWHGGEPLMAGLDFYRKAVSVQKKYIHPGQKIINGIQTNGTLLNEEICSFFADEGFIAGISIDGPREFHDKHRRYGSGQATFDKVIEGYRLLQKFKIPAEILCVVNSGNSRFPLVVYDFFRQLKASYITFLPLVEREAGNKVSCNSVGADEFGSFLISVFDEWIENDIGKIDVQIFEESTRTAFGLEHTLCIFKVNCGGVPVVEHNGDFFSCDHFVDKDHIIGNIYQRTISEMLDSREQSQFGENKSQTLPQYCINCEVRSMCNGECPKNRFINTPDGEPGLNYLCAGYRRFFNHVRPFTDALRTLREE